MSSTAVIPIPARVADAAVKTPTIMHTDEDGEYVVMRDDGTHGRPARGRICRRPASPARLGAPRPEGLPGRDVALRRAA